jgi:asparagine synthase (glutamine-hydrolysing)
LFLSNYLLSSQGDRMAMANSIEGRFPFLDHRVVELAAKMPAKLRLSGLNEKFILKQIARGQVPDQLVDRSKQPYRAPISRCFMCAEPPEYVPEMLSEKAPWTNLPDISIRQKCCASPPNAASRMAGW